MEQNQTNASGSCEIKVESPEILDINSTKETYTDQDRSEETGSISKDIRNDHLTKSLERASENMFGDIACSVYKCGGCSAHFEILNELHQHILCHTSGGSYKYIRSIRTAYPIFDTVCVSTQTASETNAVTETVSNDSDFEESFMESVNYKSSLPVDDDTYQTEADFSLSDDDNDSDPTWKGPNSTRFKRKRKVKKRMPKPNKADISSIKKHSKRKGTPKRIPQNLSSLDLTGRINDSVKSEKEGPSRNKRKSKRISGQVFIKNLAGRKSNKKREEEIGNDYDYTSTETVLLESNLDFFDSCKSDKIDQATKVNQSNNKIKKSQMGHTPFKVKLESEQKRSFTCNICEKSYISEKSLKNHKLKEHGGVLLPQECKWCFKMFEGRHNLRVHYQQCKKKDTFPCYICDETFHTRKELNEHIVVHRNDDDLTCKICKKFFINENLMQTHAKSHKWSKDKQCERCGKAFHRQYYLSKHLEYCGVVKMTIECPECSRKFKTRRSLQNHLKIHSERRPCVCHICGFTSKRGEYLNRHIRTHTGEKPYKCLICGKRFPAMSTLGRHIKVIHDNEKNNVCSFCGKSFGSKWNLKTHERQHTGDRPYKCKLCGMSFKQNVLVRLHMKSHHAFAAPAETNNYPSDVSTKSDYPLVVSTETTNYPSDVSTNSNYPLAVSDEGINYPLDVSVKSNYPFAVTVQSTKHPFDMTFEPTNYS